MLATATVFGQKNHWLLYPSHLDFSSGSMVITTESFTAGTPFNVENSIYSQDGTLLTYLQNDAVIDPAIPSTPSGGVTTKEIGVFPLPGTCNGYCAITLHPTPLASLYLQMHEFNVTSSGIEDLGVSFYGAIGNNNNPMDFYGGSGGIAISKILPNTVADRNIYIVSYSGVYKFLIDETGLHLQEHFPKSMFTYNGQPLSFDNIAEAEISPDGKWLAWNSDNYAVVFDIVNYLTVSVTELSQRISLDYIKGLEFTAGSDHLYISMRHRGVFDWTDYGQGGSSQVSAISGTQWLDYTQLQRAPDGVIYGVSRQSGLISGELRGIVPSGGTVATGVTVYSGDGQATVQYGFALPDQIDGEDEMVFHGVQPISLSSPLSFNGTPLAANTNGSVPVFYNCMPIILDDQGSGTIDNYDISITSVDPATGDPIYGNGFLDYQESFGVTPPADIRCLSKGGCRLFEKYLGGTFKIVYTISNACGSRTEEGFFQVFSGPTPANTNMVVNTGFGDQCPPAQTIAEACEASVFGASINLSQSTGDIDYYQLTFTEVDCTTGDEIEVFYEGTQVQVSDIGTVSALNLNAIEINGMQGYFFLNHFENRCIRIDAQVGNVCGGTTVHAYIHFVYSALLFRDDSNNPLKAEVGKIGSSDYSDRFLAYPNPVSDYWTVNWSNVQQQPTAIALYDGMGRMVYRKEMDAKSSYLTQQVDMSDLTQGVYYYQLVVGDEMTTGKVIKL